MHDVTGHSQRPAGRLPYADEFVAIHAYKANNEIIPRPIVRQANVY